jgi:hypothetical protein
MKFGNEFWLILFQEYISPKLFAVNKKIMSTSVPGLRYLMNAQPSNLCPGAINLSKKCKTIKSSTYSKLQGDLRIGADTRRIPISSGGVHYFVYTATAIRFIYSFSGNSAASATISTFMCLWAIIYSQDQSTYFLQQNGQIPSWEYIIAHRHMNVEIDSFLGILFSNFRHFVFAVYEHWWPGKSF